ncbi:MAG: HEAT repeat domain-containing protein [Verrucomicrobiota bacterium]
MKNHKFILAFFALSAYQSAWSKDVVLPQAAPDWQVELIASAPDIHAPTAVVEHRNGTIYLAQDPMDMNGPSTIPADSIVALNWKDGKLSKKIFADKLWAVMGLELIGGTLYVVHAPFLSAFRDTDGDGRADERVDLITGLGPPLPAFSGYNDHVPSGMRVGMDGFLYISIGDKGIPLAVGRDGKKISLRGGGVIRVRPDGTDLEIVSNGLRNPLSVALNARDDVFTYGNDDDSKKFPNSLVHNIDGGYFGYPYDFMKRSHLCLPIVGGELGGAGTQGFAFNEDGLALKFRGNLFFCDFGRQTLDRFEVKPAGGTYHLKKRSHILTSGKLRSFRPFSAAAGADGNSILVTDWTMPGQLQTGAASTGRLFRLTYHGADAIKPKQRGTDADSLDRQLESLGHSAHRERLRAQAALVNMGEKAVPGLLSVINDKKSGSARLHALWALDAIGGVRAQEAIANAIDDDVQELRTQALRALGIRRQKSTLSRITPHLADDHAPARREAAIALGRMGAKEAIDPLLAAIGDSDRFTAWSIRLALHRIGQWDGGKLSRAVMNSKGERQHQMLVLLEDAWKLPVVKAWAGIARDSDDAAVRRTALRNLAALYYKYPEWNGFWFGPNPLANNSPERTESWSDKAMQLIRETLDQALKSQHSEERLGAVGSLASIGFDAGPMLVEALQQEKDAKMRHAILLALGRAGVKVSPDLIGGMTRDDAESVEVRLTAAELLGQDHSDHSTAQLKQLLQGKNIPESLIAIALSELGRRHALDEDALLAFSSSDSQETQIAALEAMAAGDISSAKMEKTVIALLNSKNESIQAAAVRVVGARRYQSATKRLIELHQNQSLAQSVEAALAEMPSPQALDIYLAGLAAANPSHHRRCAGAMTAVRNQIIDELKTRVEAGKISAQALPVVERIVINFEPVKGWQVIGPFPRQVPDSLYRSNPDYSTTMPGAEGRSITWNLNQADAETAALDLTKFKGGTGDTGGFGYQDTGTNYINLFAHASIDSPEDREALLLIGSSGSLHIRINGKPAYNFSNLSGRPFIADEDAVRIKLKKGRNEILVRSHTGIGRWQFSAKISKPGQTLISAGSVSSGPEQLRKWALAHPGNAAKGKKLFFEDKRTACLACHAVQGKGGRIGPDLAGFGAKYDRAEAVRSILEPSQRLATGYSLVLISTKSGEVKSGLLRNETATALELVDPAGKVSSIPKSSIDERRVSAVSLMPPSLAMALSKEEFSDLVEFLVSLKKVSKQEPEK